MIGLNYPDLTDEIERLNEELRANIEIGNKNLQRTEAAERERDRYRECLKQLRDNHKLELSMNAWRYVFETLEVKP
jgi:hypothetical protein